MPQPSEHDIELFNVALEMPAGERAAYLDQACAGDDALRRRVEDLLAASEESCPCLEASASVSPGPGGQSSELALSLADLGCCLLSRRRWDEAEKPLRESLAIRRKLYESDHEQVLQGLEFIAFMLVQQGKLGEAESTARECLAGREKRMPDDWLTFSTRGLVANVLLEQKKFGEETETLLLTSYAGMKQREGTMPSYALSRIKDALYRLVRYYDESSRPVQAAEWKQKLAELEKSAR